MPDYVCPECGETAISRLVVIKGTMMHYECARRYGHAGVPRKRPREIRAGQEYVAGATRPVRRFVDQLIRTD